MNRRRLMLVIGAVFLVGGWGATRFAFQQQRVYRLVSMAVGAGFIGFAVLRRTNRNDE